MFKNALIYTMVEPVKMSTDDLEAALAEHKAHDIRKDQGRSLGWTAPAGRQHDQLVHELEGQRLLSILHQQRVLPADVVNDELEERIQDIEGRQGTTLSKKKKGDLKEEVLQELLAISHVRRKTTRVWWDVRRDRIIIEATSSKKGEEAINLLRQTLGSLKVVPLSTRMMPTKAMTQWLHDPSARPAWLALGDEAVLKDQSDDSTYTAKKVDLDTEETSSLLDTGRTVTRLGFRSEGYLKGVLTDELVLKSIKYDDAVQEQADQDGSEAENKVGRLEADFIVLGNALAAVISDLIDALDGLAKAPTADEKIARAEAKEEAEAV